MSEQEKGLNMEQTLIRYIRYSNNQPEGCVVAIPDERHGFKIGYSLLNPIDKFDKGKALQIAIGRARAYHPAAMEDKIHRMNFHYKDVSFASPTNRAVKRHRYDKAYDLFTTYFLMKQRAEKYYRTEQILD